MTFQYADDEQTTKTFQRSLTEFRVDDHKVNLPEYHKALEGINIFIKVRIKLNYNSQISPKCNDMHMKNKISYLSILS
jgi:hypothetical protein